MELISIIIGASVTLILTSAKDIFKGLFTRNVNAVDSEIHEINERLDKHEQELSSLKVSQAVQGEAQRNIKESVDHIKDTVDQILKELR